MPFASFLASLSTSSPRMLTVNRSGPGSMARMALALLEKGHNVVLIAQDTAELAEYRALLTLFSPEESLGEVSPTWVQWNHPFITVPRHPAGSTGKSGWAERLAALYSLRMRRSVQGVLVALDNFLLRLPPVNIFDTHELCLTKGMEMAPELVLEQAIDWGYVRSPMVNIPGEVAVRGDILDIFCPGYIKPLRLEFFGDTLDDIRHFDPVSQRSIADIAEVRMLPVAPVITSKKLRHAAEDFWKKEVRAARLQQQDIAALTRTVDAGGMGLFSGVYYPDASCLDDWLPPRSVFLLPGASDLSMSLESSERSWGDFLQSEAERGLHQPRSLALRPASEVTAFFARHTCVHFEDLRVGIAEKDASIVLHEKQYASFQDVFPQKEAQERPWQHLIGILKGWAEQRGATGNRTASAVGAEPAAQSDAMNFLDTDRDTGAASLDDDFVQEKHLLRGYEGALAYKGGAGRLIMSFATERARARFLKLAAQDGIVPQLRCGLHDTGVFALVSPFRKGLYLHWENTLVLGEDVLQPRVERTKRLAQGAFQGLDNYDTLRDGDLLVHRDYGVGSFGGLHRMNLGGTNNDYLLLLYAGDDRLYLPVDRLSLIQRFKCADGSALVLDRLGGNLWAGSKEKARKAIEQIAADLVEMYALRKVVKGFRYTPIGEMYREFEATFGFEETPDQARAIEEVLADMEKAEPMDRLVCGDVGFGKTEVALRAAFRAALEGRQVALLCPTTILAEQHYQTFRSRLSGFPLNVGMLSRFVTRPKQKEVLEAAARGQIDILIGTHRLLSKDVVLPNLGLLILDEEQRFGVRHKERLKEMRKNVDALTLTATPIPRTLQLSLSGIRELSVIETPPLERKPVATALIERDDATLQGILERELARQGQVFWVYNRVQGLERVVEAVKKLVPSARVGMAHGQMTETALEEAVHKFWHGELDVLVCTAIIESGLDFPRANTLIVDQAQLFGLGQLYQLRGRVGRSDRQAFAVFVTPPIDKLPEIARQRMRILLEMDYLGAGFQVAMEDLRLRGAGNILGESQSGHMNRLGLDLFLEMLEEAVAKLRGRPVQSHVETELSLGIPAFIPESYMGDSKERLRYYKLLSSAQNDDMSRDVEFEMRDRFGPLPLELEHFSAVLAFKRVLTAWGVLKADIFPDKLRISFGEGTKLDPAKLVAFVAANTGLRLQPPAILEIPIGAGKDIPSALIQARHLLARIVEEAGIREEVI